MADRGDSSWEQHEHDAVTHSHHHFHVTHNFREMTNGFEHLSSEHEHEHDHAGITHRHYPHEDFEREHDGEAHVHDHSQPVTPARAAKKASKTTKKASTD
jgi:hypothetical protein